MSNPHTSPTGHLQPRDHGYTKKSSFDDLIDGYAVPYAANSHHQTYHLSTSTPSHRRSSSHPLQHHNTLSSEHTDIDEIKGKIDLMYPPQSPVVKEKDNRRLWQKILPDSLPCRLYMITVLVETAIDLAIEGELFLRVRGKEPGDSATSSGDVTRIAAQRMPVYLSIFALAHVFQFVMAVDAVHARNTLQFVFLAVFNALFLFYAVIQIKEIQQTFSNTSSTGSVPINVLTTIIPIVISVAEIAYIGLGWKIYSEFGWKVYKFLGADRKIKKMYATYQVYECLVKFDVFFWVGFSVQFIWLVLNDSDWEFYVTCAALPLSLVLLVEGHLAARHENKWMMMTFMTGCVGAMVYFIYKLIKVLLYLNTDRYRLVWKSLTVFSVIAIVLLLTTFIYSVIVMRNFGKGLKDALSKRNNQYGAQPHRRAASTNPNRMSID